MTKGVFSVWGSLLAAMMMGVLTVGPAQAGAPLTAVGEKLMARYADQLKALQADITRGLPVIDDQEQVAFRNARDAVIIMEKEANAAQAALDASKKREGVSNHVDGAKSEGLKLALTNQAAQEVLARARTNELEAAQVILSRMDSFLKSDKWDAALLKCAVLARATPRGLAEFAQQGQEEESLVETLLTDNALMDQMLEAGGARAGKYGQAMKIYTDILKASPRAREGFGQRLALATSLEHAVPIVHESWSGEYTRLSKKPARTTVVDPVQRYLHYEKACLDGQLDPAFKDMTSWEHRHIIDSDATDEMLAWGREMLRNYRPDHVVTLDHGWRYSRVVKTEVAYLHSTEFKDSDSQEYFQNVIKNGGICGRRALFARFILQSFGIPTWGLYQAGHAATGRWTPGGWVVNLGANWNYSWFEGRSGPDFKLETQARNFPGEYRKVLRAQWVSDVLGEPKYGSQKPGSGGLWNVMAIFEEKRIVAEAKLVHLAAVGQDIGEANVSKVKSAIETVTVTDEDRKVRVAPDGVITIPAVACSKPTASTEKIVFMKSFLGGLQLHYNRLAKPEAFEYIVDMPEAGVYALCARVVTVSPDQHLLVSANDAKEPVDIALPYTLGRWGLTPSVEILLDKGKNVLRFERNDPVKGLTIKDFTLTPPRSRAKLTSG